MTSGETVFWLEDGSVTVSAVDEMMVVAVGAESEIRLVDGS